MSPIEKYSKAVKIWLWIGVFMVVIQLLIGAVTRLTEAGLSITKWDVVSGVVPPLSHEDWDNAFELYKETPQYKQINEGMSLTDFKFIFFWEYIHRLWARFMGFVFVIPFIYFLLKGQIDKRLLQKLGIVILFASLAAIFGWIMVASGLVDRPWVNAYKLSLHLILGFLVFASLIKVVFYVYNRNRKEIFPALKPLLKVFIAVLIVQVFLGGMMSGMKAAVVYPTWPKMAGQWFPSILLDYSQWTWSNFVWYDKNTFMYALVQFSHRMSGYALLLIGLILGVRWIKSGDFIAGLVIIALLVLQVLFGIITLVNSLGEVPVLLGSIHQFIAIMIVGFTTWMHSKV